MPSRPGQDRERLKNEGQAYANEVVPRAKGAAARLKEEAEGYRQRVIANAEGDTSRFKQIVREYQKAPAVTRDRMYLETMQEIFSNTTKLNGRSKKGNQLLYLPLDKLISQSGNASSSLGNSASGASTETSSGSDSDHDSSRVREDRSRGGR